MVVILLHEGVAAESLHSLPVYYNPPHSHLNVAPLPPSMI